MMPPAIWRECLPHFCAKVWKDWILSHELKIFNHLLRSSLHKLSWMQPQTVSLSSPCFPAIMNSPQANTYNSTWLVAISCQGTWCVHRSQPLQLHFLIPCFGINKPRQTLKHTPVSSQVKHRRIVSSAPVPFNPVAHRWTYSHQRLCLWWLCLYHNLRRSYTEGTWQVGHHILTKPSNLRIFVLSTWTKKTWPHIRTKRLSQNIKKCGKSGQRTHRMKNFEVGSLTCLQSTHPPKKIAPSLKLSTISKDWSVIT